MKKAHCWMRRLLVLFPFCVALGEVQQQSRLPTCTEMNITTRDDCQAMCSVNRQLLDPSVFAPLSCACTDQATLVDQYLCTTPCQPLSIFPDNVASGCAAYCTSYNDTVHAAYAELVQLSICEDLSMPTVSTCQSNVSLNVVCVCQSNQTMGCYETVPVVERPKEQICSTFGSATDCQSACYTSSLTLSSTASSSSPPPPNNVSIIPIYNASGISHCGRDPTTCCCDIDIIHNPTQKIQFPACGYPTSSSSSNRIPRNGNCNWDIPTMMISSLWIWVFV